MERLEEFDRFNPYILWIFVGSSLTWAITAAPMMITAFIVGQVCPPDDTNCTTTPGTLIHEFNLTGDRSHLAGITTSMYLFGNMLGASTMSRLADLLGRRPLIIINVSMLGLLGCLSAASQSIYQFIVLRFIQGVFFPGCGITAWVLAYESVGARWRAHAALVFGLAWVAGYCAVGPLARWLPHWRQVAAAAAAPSALLGLLYHCAMPESYHFMVSRGREPALARWLANLNRFKRETRLGAAMLISEHYKQQQTDATHGRNFFVELFMHKKLLLYTVVFTYLWTCDVFVYYGLSLFSADLAGDKYWNYVLIGLIEVPSYAISPYLLVRLGRRWFVSGSHFLTGVTFLGAIFIDDPTVSLLLWLIGKFGISCAFTCLFVFASEVFPTNLRSGCIGAVEVLARLGGVFAPQANELKFVYEKLPVIFFTVVATVGGLATLILPETRGQNLPDTSCEAENRAAVRSHEGSTLVDSASA